MNYQNRNQFPYRDFAPPAIQGQPDRRSTGSSSTSNVVNVNLWSNNVANSRTNIVWTSYGTSSATIHQAYCVSTSPANFMPPSAGSDTLMVVATDRVPTDGQPPPSFRVSQNGTGNGGNCPPPMIPVTKRRIVTSSYPISACSSIRRYSSCGCSRDIPVAQQGAPGVVMRSSPMTPAISHSSVASDGTIYSAVGSSTTGFPGEEMIYSNGPVGGYGSCYTRLNPEVFSSASSEYGSERSYGSSEASSCGIFCFNCSGNRNPDTRTGADDQDYCLYCLKPTRRQSRRFEIED